jgi:membrane protein YqaA with SNARE-associated domain
MLELLGLLGASFAAATLFPLPSEAALFAYLQAHPDRAALAVAVATVGNTAGGMTTYVLARFLPPSRKIPAKTLQALRRFGAPITFFAWLPVAGDALCAAAGWLRIRWWAALAFMAAGRLLRYIVVAWLST